MLEVKNREVLILSATGREVVARVMRKCLGRYWGGCRYDVRWVVGGNDFGGALIDYLVGSDAEVVLLLLDDYWFYEPVDEALLERVFRLVESGDAKQVRLYNSDDSEECGSDWLRHIKYSSEFIAGITASVWNKQYLLSFLRRNETAWDFSKFSQERKSSDLNFCTKQEPIRIFSYWIVREGKMTEKAQDFLNRTGITLE